MTAHKDHAGVWVPPPVVFAGPLITAAAMHSMRPWPITDGNPIAVQAGALVIIAAAVALGLTSVASFRNASTTILPAGRPTTSIVERGPYRFTRNPMYVAMACAYLGLALALNNLWALIFLPAVVAAVDRFVIRREERYLTAKFGDTYVDYCARVRRWV